MPNFSSMTLDKFRVFKSQPKYVAGSVAPTRVDHFEGLEAYNLYKVTYYFLDECE